MGTDLKIAVCRFGISLLLAGLAVVGMLYPVVVESQAPAYFDDEVSVSWWGGPEVGVSDLEDEGSIRLRLRNAGGQEVAVYMPPPVQEWLENQLRLRREARP